MAQGTLIAESLKLNHSLAGPSLLLQRVTRLGPLQVPPDQPDVWTFIEFTVDDDKALATANALADALAADLPWYCDFRTANDTFVVFSQRIFRYRRGDTKGRTEAVEYGRSLGAPETQLDWPE